VVVYLWGRGDNGVITYLQDYRIPIVDLRPDDTYFERDTIGDFDGHPGPFSHYSYFKKIAVFIDKNIVAY